MTSGHDELTRPLGLEPPAQKRWRVSLPWAQFFIATVAGLFLLLAGFLAVVRDPQGGEPIAIAVIDRTIQKAEPPAAPAGPAAPAAQDESTPANALPGSGHGVTVQAGLPPKTPNRAAAADVERDSGVKVIRQGGADSPGALVIQVPSPNALAPAPAEKLVERSRHGILPKIAADGTKPMQVYARPAPPPLPKVAGRIAIVVGGVGLSQATTADAIVKLPPAVTLAFAPYGTDLERQAARAREDGHEILVQVPMEPFDYPDNDPGPHTLVTSTQSNETIDRLAWVMSRLPGYVGVMNYMGGKFTASDAALTPVLREVGGRGLLYLDDGSSPRSLAPSLATSLKVPAAKADVIVDAQPRGAAIDDQLARLEAVAREKGVAIGSANALPVSIDRIAAWAKTLEAKGIQLVPLTAALPPLKE